jgi:hypothetical protein
MGENVRRVTFFWGNQGSQTPKLHLILADKKQATKRQIQAVERAVKMNSEIRLFYYFKKSKR